MNFRLTAIFFVLVVLLVAALLVSVMTDSDTNPADGIVPELTRAGLKEKDVDTVEITRTSESGQERLVVVKTPAGKWEAREPVTARVDGFAVDGIVRDLLRAKPARDPEPGENLAVRGLDTPTVQVTLKAGDRAATVNLGQTIIGGDRAVTYVTTSAAPKRPLAVRRSDLGSLFRESARTESGAAFALVKWLPDLRGRRLLGADLGDPVTDAQAVKITAGGKEVALKRGTGGGWEFVTPAGWGEADVAGDTEARPNTAALTGVRPLLSLLTGLQAGGVTDFIEQPGDLAQYGLAPNDPNLVRVELTTAAGAEVLSLGKAVEEGGKPVVPAKVFGKLEGDSAVVKVQTDRLDALRQTAANPGELRNKDLIASAKRDQIDAIDLTAGTATVKLRKVAADGGGPRWLMYGDGGAADVKGGEVEALLTALTKSRAVKELLPAPDDTAFAAPEVKATARLWVSGVEKPKDEKKDDKEKDKTPDAAALPPEPKVTGTPVELVFGRREPDGILVRKTAEGKAVDVKLPDATLALVTKSRVELLDPKLKSFDTGKVERLAVTRGDQQVVVTRTADGGWTLGAPDSPGGRAADAQAVSGLLGLLAGLFAERVVAENPPDAELAKWGLGAGAVTRVTVDLKDDADKQRVYEFGANADDKSVFARQAGRPVVFTVPKATADRLRADDMRDKTLFKLDLAKVQRVKLRGWAGLVGPQPLEYLLKREGGGWAAVSPPTPAGFAPDVGKVTALLAALAAPRAAAFVDVADKPQYGLSPDTAPSRLEFTVEQDGAAPVTLVLGSPADGGRVYGMSSAVPGEVFTFDATQIKSLTDKPAALQK